MPVHREGPEKMFLVKSQFDALHNLLVCNVSASKQSCYWIFGVFPKLISVCNVPVRCPMCCH